MGLACGVSEKHLYVLAVANLWRPEDVLVALGRGRAFARPRTADLLAMARLNVQVYKCGSRERKIE